MTPMDFKYSGIYVIQRSQKTILSKFNNKTQKPDITACTKEFWHFDLLSFDNAGYNYINIPQVEAPKLFELCIPQFGTKQIGF